MVRSVTRQVEPEWDDDTRDLVEGLARYDIEVCPGCGLHPVVLDDPDHNHFTFEERHCTVCAGQAAYGRIVADRDEQERKALGEQQPAEPQPGDGRHIYLRGMSPAEVEAARQRKEANQ